MCGRYANFLAHQDLVDAFAIASAADEPRLLPPSWNIAPTQPATIVVARAERADAGDEPTRGLETARWGLVPSWSKDPSAGPPLFNARAETVAEKPSFRTAYGKRRCLVPANGYYEWQVTPEGKVPHFIHPADGAPLGFAGIYEFWRDKALGDDAPWLATFSILTVAAREGMAAIHDRQPVMLTPECYSPWLDPSASASELTAVIAAPAPELAWHPVGAAVGNVRNNSAELVEPVSA